MKLPGWHESEFYIYKAMEHLRYGNLGHYLEVERSESEAKVVIRKQLKGLVVIHKEEFAHWKLKPEVGGIPFILSRIT